MALHRFHGLPVLHRFSEFLAHFLALLRLSYPGPNRQDTLAKGVARPASRGRRQAPHPLLDPEDGHFRNSPASFACQTRRPPSASRAVRAGSVPDQHTRHLPDAPQKAGLEAQILPLMQRQPDLLDAALATVVPEHPSLAIEDRIWFVNSVVVPLVLARPNDGVGSMALPVGDAVL